MLVEINCDKFREKTIRFQEGLNVVLGDEKATNSIGKSILLMVIDFVFGGKGLLIFNTDVVKELGDHDYRFSFIFNEQQYYFKRGTYRPDLIYICDEKYTEKEPIDIGKYTSWLKENYRIPYEDISFRSFSGLYSRIWGKENLDVKRPLHYFHRQKSLEAVNNLIKVFNRYGNIRELSIKLKQMTEENTAINKAFKNKIIPKILKSEYKANEKSISRAEREIEDIKLNLAKYATSLNEIINREVLELKKQKDALLPTKLEIDSKLARLRKNINDSKYIKSKNLIGLKRFFPDVNVERIMNIDEFHSGISKILMKEMKLSEKQLIEQLDSINSEIKNIDFKISSSIKEVKDPGIIIDRVYQVSNELSNAKQENDYYDTARKIKNDIKEIKTHLGEEKTSVLKFISDMINDKIRNIVNEVYSAQRKSPVVTFTNTNYSFEIYDDTGTGKAYSNLLVFDLSVFSLTSLPFLIHDSLLYKNIENNVVAKMIDIYESIKKQSFIAIDEIDKYGNRARNKLWNNRSIKLDNENLLYIKDWRG